MRFKRPSNRVVVEWIIPVFIVVVLVALAVGGTQHPDEPFKSLVEFAPDSHDPEDGPESGLQYDGRSYGKGVPQDDAAASNWFR